MWQKAENQVPDFVEMSLGGWETWERVKKQQEKETQPRNHIHLSELINTIISVYGYLI